MTVFQRKFGGMMCYHHLVILIDYWLSLYLLWIFVTGLDVYASCLQVAVSLYQFGGTQAGWMDGYLMCSALNGKHLLMANEGLR